MIPEEGFLDRKYVPEFAKTIGSRVVSVNHTEQPKNPTCDHGTTSKGRMLVRKSKWPVFVFTQSCYLKIMNCLSYSKLEKGGVIFGPTSEPWLLSHFEEDKHGRSSPTSFELDRESLNEFIQVYKTFGLEMKAIVHSHPLHCPTLSVGDIRYLGSLFDNPANVSLRRLFMPIVCGQKMFAYTVTRRLNVFSQPVVLV